MRNLLTTAAIGGAMAGVLDAIYASVLWGVVLGSNPAGVWQAVAAGLLGPAAFLGGNATVAFGLALHFFIAFCMALTYVLASRRLPVLVTRPLLMGVLYGVPLYLVMNFVVIPLSALEFRPPDAAGVIRALLAHVLLVGPAIALVAARRARPDERAAP